jgi:ADP-ribosylglycohydrolase
MKLKHIILLSIAVLLFSTNVDAQCAMCKAVAETGSSDGIPVSGGINQAILYLMALPYILLFLLFRKKLVGFYREWKAMWK